MSTTIMKLGYLTGGYARQDSQNHSKATTTTTPTTTHHLYSFSSFPGEFILLYGLLLGHAYTKYGFQRIFGLNAGICLSFLFGFSFLFFLNFSFLFELKYKEYLVMEGMVWISAFMRFLGTRISNTIQNASCPAFHLRNSDNLQLHSQHNILDFVFILLSHPGFLGFIERRGLFFTAQSKGATGTLFLGFSKECLVSFPKFATTPTIMHERYQSY
jgi:hypothetical protein